MRVEEVRRHPLWVLVMWTIISVMLIAGAFLKGEPLLFVIGLMGLFVGTSKSTLEILDDGLQVTHRYFELLKLRSFYPFKELRYISVYPYGRDNLFVVEMWWKGFRGRKILLPQDKADNLVDRLRMQEGVIVRE